MGLGNGTVEFDGSCEAVSIAVPDSGVDSVSSGGRMVNSGSRGTMLASGSSSSSGVFTSAAKSGDGTSAKHSSTGIEKVPIARMQSVRNGNRRYRWFKIDLKLW